MAVANLNNGEEHIDTSLDNIVIIDVLERIVGGRTLCVDGFKPPVIKAGHVIIMETEAKEYKPMPVKDDGTYADLPAGHKIVGVAYSSALTRKPFMTIMVRGSVNKVASPYVVTVAIETALQGLIRFTQD